MTILVISCIILFLLIDTLYDLLEELKASLLKFLHVCLLEIYTLITCDLFHNIGYFRSDVIRYVPVSIVMILCGITSVCIYFMRVVAEEDATDTK